MNTKIKVAFGVITGLIAGVMLVGTAVAVPQMMTAPSFNSYTMMGAASSSGAYDRPIIAEMNAFMDGYRTSNGSIDINRMHDDVVNGNVTAPCFDGTSGNSARYGMMGSTY